jgi:malate dehydrogenase (oxaloacetate-decarboxylating)(NADP+)
MNFIMAKFSREEVLEYHSRGRPGKIEVIATKPLDNQRDLSLAYSPGVAEAVLQVAEDPESAYQYTAKSNLVAVISDGTAILGLGDRGPLASKPVMEGKGVLFKTFADIDVFDIEVEINDPDHFISVVKAIAPTFGGINLEDIKAPECFYIEETLKSMLPIPVFHDDQHGTAIISAAALLNSLEITGKKIEDMKMVVSGAGASAIACAKLYVSLGIKQENILMVDSRGVIHDERDDINEYKREFAVKTNARSLADAMVDADVFLGLSVKDLVSPEMVKTMARDPMIFAMANPDPEIPYDVAREARPDAIIGTGRSDYPNQVNNVLGFPFIFRGALDVAASAINEEMKIAAAKSLAALAHEEVPDSVLAAYNKTTLHFGREYIIPKPLDPRVLLWEAPAVAQAAMDSGVARHTIDMDEYREQLVRRQSLGSYVKQFFINRARSNPKRIVFGEGEVPAIIRAAHQVQVEGIGDPILLGDPEVIKGYIHENELDFHPTIINPATSPRLEEYTQTYYEMRKRKGHTLDSARHVMKMGRVYGPMMVHLGHADTYLAGVDDTYPNIIRPALKIFGTSDEVSRASGLYLILAKGNVYIFTDPTVNIETNAEELADIAIMTNDFARKIDLQPVVALLSFSSFGTTPHPLTQKVKDALHIVKERRPDIKIDGEVQADFAVDADLMEKMYPFSEIRGANVLVFPDLQSANIAYRLMDALGGADKIGPILLGTGAPVHVLQQGETVDNIVTMAAVAVMDAQRE